MQTKRLAGIPWMVAFALRADGWYLRSDIIWHKPNPMPESVTDRPTKSHEYLFLLTKSSKYYYDYMAITETGAGRENFGQGQVKCQNNHDRNDAGRLDMTVKGYRNKRDVWTITTQPCKEAHYAVMPEKLVEPCILAGSKPGDIIFDPFMGSGTVERVAIKHGRRAIGTELNFKYITDISSKRTTNIQVCLPIGAEA